MALNFNDYLTYMKSGSYRPRVKVQFLRKDETPYGEEITADILTGGLAERLTNGVRKSLDITLHNRDGVYLPNKNKLWFNQKLILWFGYNIAGEDYFFQKGVFVIGSPSAVSKGSQQEVSIQCDDKFSLLNGENAGKLSDIYLINYNTNINTAIKSLLNDAGDIRSPILKTTSLVTPYTIRTSYNNTYADPLIEICEGMSQDVYYDNFGHLRSHPVKLNENIPSKWDFNYGDDLYSYLGSTMEYNWSGVKNAIKVIGDTVDGSTYTGYAQNDSLSSEFSVPNIGLRLGDIIENSLLQSNSAALALAKYELAYATRLNNSINIECIPLYHLEVNDFITLTDPNLNLSKERFIINQIDTDFKNGGIMKINATQFTRVEVVTS